MKVYFSSTIKAKKILAENFRLIYQTVEKLGHKHVSDFLIKVDPDQFYFRPTGMAQEHYRKMLRQVQAADGVIFEVSIASLGVGYLVNLVLAMEKPVILLHTKDKPPYLFKFIKSEKLQICEYTPDNIQEILTEALETARESVNVRFTFFVTPRILQFFDFIAKKKRVPRAVYLRKLIDEAIRKEKFKPQNPF